ncbi:glutaredoxin domain-containing protein [Mycobacterium branderi]|nr:glutaredoxin domain-containing protein [Mycobacterium branderi]MCV7234564.1 NrdH-redoxin [Mycobacterium branderi]ORA28807.1 NrdH-redoxin [Mycobacterium branderi]
MQCKATFHALDREGITYSAVDISENADARDYLLSLGYLQIPVVVAGAEQWAGFRPDRIRALTGAA